MAIVIEPLEGPNVADRPFEIVERKGLGHPDSICDALAERLSVSLSKFYLESFGTILHHNVDKALLWAGTSEPAFGGGRVSAPMNIYLAGRATAAAQGVTVPIEELAVAGTRAWFRDNFHALDPAQHVRLHCLVRPGSPELVELFLKARKTGIWLANDTSCGVGYAPMSDLERTVLAVERALNALAAKSEAPETGEDIKIMGLREGRELTLTIACAFIGSFLQDLDAYRVAKQQVAERAAAAARRVTDMPVAIRVNTGDDMQAGDVYLTVTGTSAESGDDGQAGRGNRVNGLITPFRPMTMEAAAGKNPITHVGKLYNTVAGLIAEAAVERLEEVREAQCYLLSQIGSPVTEPRMALIRARTDAESLGRGLSDRLEALARENLSGIGELWKQFVAEELRVV